MIDTRLLRHLMAVASHPTVQAAADSLHLTQPSLTKSIARFEESIGAKLFDRRGHKLVLTELGQRIVAGGEQIMRNLQELEEEITVWKDIGAGDIEIGVEPGAELSILPSVLQAFVPEHPGVHVRIRSGQTLTLLPALLAGDLHFLVADAELASERTDLDIQPLARDQLAAAVRPGHPLEGKEKLSPEDIAAHPFISSSTAPRFKRWQVERGQEETGKPFVASLICDNFEVLIRLGEESDSVVVGPHELLLHYQKAGRLKIMPWALNSPEVQPSLIRSKGRPMSPAVELMAELFLDASR